VCDVTELRAHVRVPATSANLGPGFDTLGLALAWYDDVSAVRADSGLQIDVTGVGEADLPRDESHLIVRAMDAAFAELGEERGGLTLQCANTIPHGLGLGSSAAAIVAGVLLARALVPDGNQRLDDAAALRVAARLEGHPDNAAAALLGGFTIAWPESSGARAVRLQPAGSLRAVVLLPSSTLNTELARGLLPATVPHVDAAHSAARSALLVHAVTAETDLLFAATEDRLHQAYRESAMPETLGLVAVLRSAGLAAVVSGAGPSILVLGGDELTEGAVAAEAGHADDGWTVRSVDLDRAGARLLSPLLGDPDLRPSPGSGNE
jgi:homoserine kinase